MDTRYGMEICEDIHGIQKPALRIIAPIFSYEEILASFNLLPLSERRDKHCVDLIKQMPNQSHKLHHLLPEKVECLRKKGN